MGEPQLLSHLLISRPESVAHAAEPSPRPEVLCDALASLKNFEIVPRSGAISKLMSGKKWKVGSAVGRRGPGVET